MSATTARGCGGSMKSARSTSSRMVSSTSSRSRRRTCALPGWPIRSSNNFGNARQLRWPEGDIPIISTALGTTNDTTFATTINRGEAGRLAANIAQNVTRMNTTDQQRSPQASSSRSRCLTRTTRARPSPCRTSSSPIRGRRPTPCLWTTSATANYHALQVGAATAPFEGAARAGQLRVVEIAVQYVRPERGCRRITPDDVP